MDNETLHLQLTRGEVLWLGRIFSKTAFPFLFPAGKLPDMQSLAAEIRDGRDSLIQKQWVVKAGHGRFEVDRLIYFLVDWLSQPEEVAVVETVAPENSLLHYALYKKDGHFLWVEVQTEHFELTLCPDTISLSEVLYTRFLQTAEDHKQRSEKEFPLLQPLELIQLAWKSEQKAKEALRVANYLPDQIHSLLPWLAKLNAAGIITKYAYHKSEEEPVAQYLFVKDEEGYWLSDPVDQNPKIFIMNPISSSSLITQIIE
jgi:hypothetical protein